jgi:hypothetical protein
VERSGEIHFKVASKPELGMSFSTDRVGRDGENTTSERVTFQVVNGGGLEIGRGRVVEKIQNTDDGTQQSWRFTEKPRGNGDLEVDVAVRNAPSQVSDDLDGLKFALKGAPGVIRYSHGTWIDGDGRRTKVASRWENGRIVLRVPERLVEESKYPAVLDPTVGAEFGMGSVGGGGLSGWQSEGVASDGANFFLVAHGEDDSHYSYGILFDSVGKQLTITDFGVGWSLALAWGVVFDGTRYVVLRRTTSALSAIPVDKTGKPLDAEKQLSTGAWDWASMASDGSGNLLVVGVQNKQFRIFRVNSSLSVLDQPPMTISSSQVSPENPQVVWNGTSYTVVWDDNVYGNYDVFGATISTGGVVIS